MAKKQHKMEILVLIKDLLSSQLKTILGNLNKTKSAVGTVGQAFSKAFTGITGALGKVTRVLTSMPAMITGIAAAFGAWRLGKSFLAAATGTERLKARLSILLGTVEEGNRLFKEMLDLAGRVPVTLEQLEGASTSLAAVMTGGADEVARWLPLIADLAEATGLSIEETTDNIQKMYSAGASAAITFQRKGINTMLGFQRGVSYSAAETRKRLMEAWTDSESRFRGAAAASAVTWQGLMSMLADAWYKFRSAVMDAGLFKFLKGGVTAVLDEINRLQKEGKLDDWAQRISDAVISAMKTMLIFIGNTVDSIQNMFGFLGKALTNFIQVYYRIEDRLNGVSEAAAQAHSRLADETFLRAAIANLHELEAEYKKLDDKMRASGGGLPEPDRQRREELQAEILKYAQFVEVFGNALDNTAENIDDKVKTIMDRMRQLAKQKELFEGFRTTTSATDLATKAVTAFDQAVAKLQKTEADRAAAEQERPLLRPEPEQLSAIEQATVEAQAGAARLQGTLASLGAAYKTHLVDLQTYYAQRQTAIAEQYDRERKVLVLQLDELAKNELDRRAAIQEQIQTLEEKLAAGAADRSQRSMQQQLLNLQAQLESNVDYVKAREKLANKLLQTDSKYQTAAEQLREQERRDLQRHADEVAKIQQSIADTKLDALQKGMRPLDQVLDQEMEIIKRKATQQRQDLTTAYNEGLISSQEYMQGITAITEQVQAESFARQQEKYRALADSVGSTLSDMGSMFEEMYKMSGEKAKEYFYAWKAIAIAEALVSTYLSAQKAYEAGLKTPFVGSAAPVVATAMAAIATAAGLARVANIAAQSFATGGEVEGPAGRDVVPARLTAGEYVHPVDTVRYYGSQAMEAVRQRIVPRALLRSFAGIPHIPTEACFQTGGLVNRTANMGPEQRAAGGAPGEGGGVQIINVPDPNLVGQYLQTKPGQKQMMNFLSENSFQLRQILTR